MIAVATERRRCLVTGKWVHPKDGIGFGNGQTIFYSFEGLKRHYEALHLLSTGEPPKACQDCGKPSSECASLFVHRKDGIYQALCRSCSDRYEQKAKELYRDTPYGAKRKL